jgi:NADH-quinone oxidoreductase subunit L
MMLFPTDDYSLIAIILGMPLLGAFINGVWGKRLGDTAVRVMALSAVGVSFGASVVAFASLLQFASQEHGAHVRLIWNAWEWMHTTGGTGNVVPVAVRFSIDALSGVMMLVVTGVGFLIHLYATSYMAGDKGFARFFAYLNLFIFSMLVLILADNLPLLFVGWEGVGLCSYLLIGFWYETLANAAAGKKAFIANRIGDFGLLVAMFLLVRFTGSLDWNGLENGASSLVSLSGQGRVDVWPPGGGEYTGVFHWLQPSVPLTILPATAVGLALLLGCTGKSAQIPLYVWLPDAMAGPTPVSALIHAATMVTAGIYLVCRLAFVFVLSPFTMMCIAIIGAATALLAATIAVVQNDIKKVLAYSTISQLGFMFLGVGSGSFEAGFFHVFTHAFFKACLFLGAGSVIHAMHARIHDADKTQDLRYLGGLRKWLPHTHWTFLAATLAIIGFPLTSGFFSKEEILYRELINHSVSPMRSRYPKYHFFEPPQALGTVLFWTAVIAACLTAFYMCRLYFLTFWGDFKGWTVGRPSLLAKQELEASPHDAHDTGDGDDHHPADDLSMPGYAPHESPWQMTIPLMILAVFAVAAGLLNHLGGDKRPMDHWLEPVFKTARQGAVVIAEGHTEAWAQGEESFVTTFGVLAFAVGTGLAWWMYIAKKGAPAKSLSTAMPGLYRLVLDKWRIDELYDATILAGVDSVAETSAAVDKYVVDGLLARFTSLVVAASGSILRTLQTGVVHVYGATMVVGLVAMGWFFATPHPDATVADAGNDDYVITAAPGVGYKYRWDADGDGAPDKPEFGPDTTLKLHVEAGKTTTVNLEVRNAFGFVKSRAIQVAHSRTSTSSL